MLKLVLHLLWINFLLIPVGFSQEIEIVTQEKIQGVITILAYSPDGKLIASGSEKENSIKVWDVFSGKIIGKLEGHEDATSALQFNADGTRLISAAEDNRVMLWDLMNWKMLDSITVENQVTTFQIDPTNNSLFYSGDDHGRVQKWNTNSFTSPVTVYEQSQPISTISYYSQKLISGDNSGKVIYYDLAANKEIRSEKLHLGAIKGLDFYNDGKGIISAGNGGKIRFWDLETMKEVNSFSASTLSIWSYDSNIEKGFFVTASQNNTIRVWDLEGKQRYEFKSRVGEDGDVQPVKAIQISPDGTAMASSGFQRYGTDKNGGNKNVIRIWDLKRGTQYKTLEGAVNPIYTFDFHPTQNKLVTLGDDHKLTFWNFNLAEKYGEFELVESKRELAGLRRTGKNNNNQTAEEAADKTVDRGKKARDLFNKVKNGNLSGLGDVAKDRGKTVGVGFAKRMFKERSIVKYSEKGTYLITKLKGDEIRLYSFDGETPEYQDVLFSYQLSINQLLSSPDEKYLAVLGSGDSAISIVDLETKAFVRKLSTPAPKDNFKFIYEANSLAFSPDGKLLAVCFNTGKTFVYHVGGSWSLAFENALPDNLGYVESPFVNFSKDGKYMIVKSMRGVIKYDTKDFNIFNSEPLAIDGYSAPMDKPQDYAITIKENYIYFENVFTGTVQKSIRVTPSQVTHISINSNGMVGITFKSGQFQLLDPNSGSEEVLLVADGDNYIFKTSDNFYKVSKEGRDLVTFRIGNQAFPFEQFDAVFNRPDLVLKKMGCQDMALMALYEKAYKKRIKKLGLQPTTEISLTDIPTTEITNSGEIPAFTEKGSITLNATLGDDTGLKRYNIWVNNVPIHGKKGKSIKGTEQIISQEVPLVYGLNKIQISCQNKNGYESLIQTFYVEKEGEKPKRDLYLVTIGTSDYKDSRYDLTYPVKDAKDLSELMKSNTSGLYEEVFIKNLFDQDVTTENITGLKTFLDKSKPDDVVIVFVAGHGVLDEEYNYYFGTHDIDFTNPSENGLAYDKLEQILDGIKANRKILIMDTCHSGEVDKDEVVQTTNEEQEQGDITFRSVGTALTTDESEATPSRLAGELFNDLRKGTGTTVISSAGGVEFAMESDEWKNGLFTYCMLNGLKNRTADIINEDGIIMLSELQQYVVERVTALSHGKQVPNARIMNIELDFPIW